MNQERRLHRRAVLGADYSVRFIVNGHLYRDVRITNLSMSGCFATVHSGDEHLFFRGARLEQFSFEGPGLPSQSFTALVAYTLGNTKGMQSVMGLGIEFTSPPETVLSDLQAFLEG